MLAREAIQILEGMDHHETVFRKKNVILRLCSRYDARLCSLQDNLDVFRAFLGHYMRYRLAFQKKDAAIDGFVDRFHAFVKMMPGQDNVLAFLLLCVLLAVFSNSYAQVRAVHDRLVAFLGDGGWDALHIPEIIRILRANGFYHFPYEPLLSRDPVSFRPTGAGR